MSAQVYIVLEERLPGGEIARKRVPYVGPSFPVRDLVIVQRQTGAPILETPGGTAPGERGSLKRGKTTLLMEPSPYRVLRRRHDQMHATLYTPAEAAARIAQWPELGGVAVPVISMLANQPTQIT
jgi:hypothetical protein